MKTKTNKLLLLLVAICCWSCSKNSETEKYQKERDKVTSVREKIKEIKIDNVLIGGNAQIQLMGNYLIIGDHRSYDKQVHLFDKNNFSYLASTAYKGEGPDEITILGAIGVDEAHRKFYVSDHGKLKIFSYHIDSVLTNPLYRPEVKMNMNQRIFPSVYQYINDTLCIGRIIEPIGNNDFKPSTAKWNMETGEIKLMKYEHPAIQKKRMVTSTSMEHGIYVECYLYHDLMTICSLDGSLKYNIYGSKWDTEPQNKISYYGEAIFCGDKILAPYSGEKSFIENKNEPIRSNQPTKILVFDMDGNYLQTLETELKILHLCYDKEKNRIIMNLDDEMQFAYLDIAGLLK